MRRRLSKLVDYQTKRDFSRSPEPVGKVETTEAAFPRFVIQEHHARRLHWDFRLEKDGVLKSWAVPKGLPLEVGVKRLAIEVEDHPLSYIDFAGTIPPGNYGAGAVSIWDHGRYAVAEWKSAKIVVVLLGERVQGSYHMVRTNAQQWLIFRGKEL